MSLILDVVGDGPLMGHAAALTPLAAFCFGLAMGFLVAGGISVKVYR